MIFASMLMANQNVREETAGSETLKTCIASLIITDYYFKFPSNFQEILMDQEHLSLNLCTQRSKPRFDTRSVHG